MVGVLTRFSWLVVLNGVGWFDVVHEGSDRGTVDIAETPIRKF